MSETPPSPAVATNDYDGILMMTIDRPQARDAVSLARASGNTPSCTLETV